MKGNLLLLNNFLLFYLAFTAWLFVHFFSFKAGDVSELAIVNLIVQLLGTFLCENPTTHYKHLPAAARRLHDYALQRLNAIGPAHPEEFKRVLRSFPALKSK